MSERVRKYPRRANDWRFFRGAKAVLQGLEAGPSWGAMRKAVQALASASDETETRSALNAVRATFWCVTRDPHRNQPTKARKALVASRDGGRCVRCGDDGADHIDHLYPKYRGGANQPWNLALLCAHCNLTKGHDIVPWALLLMVDQAEAEERRTS